MVREHSSAGIDTLDAKTREVLFVEIHGKIWDAAYDAIAAIRSPDFAKGSLNYPPKPDGLLSDEEVRALRKLATNEVTCFAIKKLIADACAAAFFHVFALMDAVGDPQLSDVEEWLGIDMTPANPDTPESELPLHDELFDSYWRFKEINDRTQDQGA